jgi:hypothetical protein
MPEQALNETEISMPELADTKRPTPIEVKPKSEEDDYFSSK